MSLRQFKDTLKPNIGYSPCVINENDAVDKANFFIDDHKNAKIIDISHEPCYERIQLPDNPENRVLSHYCIITVQF